MALAGSQGNFELNVFKPVMIFNLLTMCRLVGDTCRSFSDHLLAGLQADTARISPACEVVIDAGDGFESAYRLQQGR